MAVDRSKKYSIGNWKMNTDLADAMVLSQGILDGVEDLKGAEVVLCPPFVWLYPIAELLKHSPKHVSLGAQNMHWQEKGAFTGEISPMMIKDMADYVILGHSERRFHFNESDDLINDKVLSALTHGLTSVLCIGEKSKPKSGAGSDEMIDQLVKDLANVTEACVKDIIIAYEPVWAIGTGDAATAEYAGDVAKKIRKKVSELYNNEIAENMPILYGGSVTNENIAEYMDECDIDGALVGGASLKIDNFIGICKEVGKYR